MIKSFKDFDLKLNSQKVYESFDDDNSEEIIFTDDDIDVPRLISRDAFFIKISRIILKKLDASNLGEFGVHPTIVTINGVDGVHFYSYDNPSINIVICRNVNVKKAYLFKNFEVSGKNKADLVLSTDKLGFKEIIDDLIYQLSQINTKNTIVEARVAAGKWTEGSFRYSDVDVAIVANFNLKIRQYIIDELKSSNSNKTQQNIWDNQDTTVQPYRSIYDEIARGYNNKVNQNIVKKVVDMFTRALSGDTKHIEIKDILEGCKFGIGGGPAVIIENGVYVETSSDEDSIDDQLEKQIEDSLKKYEKDLKKIETVTRAMCRYVKLNGNRELEDFSGLSAKCLLITGDGGAGKSRKVNDVLKEEGMVENRDYFKAASGSSAPQQLFKNLYDYNRKLLIFDDSLGLFDDGDKISLWQHALDPDRENNTLALKKSTLNNKANGNIYDPTAKKRTGEPLTRQDRYFLEIGKSSIEEKTKFYKEREKEILKTRDTSSLGFDEIQDLKNDIRLDIDAEWEAHEEAKEPLMPNRFLYSGLVIIISNHTREDLKNEVGKRFWGALKDRMVTRDLKPMPQAIWRKIKEELLIQKDMDPKKLTDKQCIIPRRFIDVFIKKVEELLEIPRYCHMTWRIVTDTMNKTFQGEIGISDWEDTLMEKMDTTL